MLDLGSLLLELWILQRGLSSVKTMDTNLHRPKKGGARKNLAARVSAAITTGIKVHSLNDLTPFVPHPRSIK